MNFNLIKNFFSPDIIKKIARAAAGLLVILIFAGLPGGMVEITGYSPSLVLAAPTVAYPAEEPFYPNVQQEMRGTWIASVDNINFPSKTGLTAEQQRNELDTIVRTCKEVGLNAIFFQVRPCGDALYDSGIFPTSKFLTGKQGETFVSGFDPLKYIIIAAHNEGIEVHAWVNPYRITNGSLSAPQTDVKALSVNNPARLHPEYTVTYDGKLFYNPALPEVRELIKEGVAEIIRNYKVDGIHFDDYFYPYPIYQTVGGKSVKVEFDDSAAFKKYGAGASLDLFRRYNVNTLIKDVYAAIKSANQSCRFGVSPFGIWANKGSTVYGSETTGFEAYYQLNCDATAWAAGGYVDYLCPQIYWAFSTKAAGYDILVRWWSKVLDGTGVDLYIGHGAYKAADYDEREIPRQVEYARAYMGVKGSVFYGYRDITANNAKLKTNLTKLFATGLEIGNPVSNGQKLSVSRPANESVVNDANVTILGSSNPAYPVTYNGIPVTRTKDGYFSEYIPLNNGLNNITFEQNGIQYVHTVFRGSKPGSGTSAPYKYPQMNSYKIEVLNPGFNLIVNPGEKVQVKIQAPSGSAVTAKLGSTVVKLTPLTNPPNEGKYMTEVYSGTITLPSTQPNGSVIELGDIIYTATRSLGESANAKGINIKLTNGTVKYACEVITDNAYLKKSVSSSFYNDYLPASVGMRDYIVSLSDGYYKLSFGGYVAEDDVKTLGDRNLLPNKILHASTDNIGKITQIKFEATENVPVDAKLKNGVFSVTLYNTSAEFVPGMFMGENPIFGDIDTYFDAVSSTATYKFTLIDPENFYGFDVVYSGSCININVRNPYVKPSSGLPLAGLDILVDAGHGGIDTGAIGFGGASGKNEKNLNLEISLAVQTKLKMLGANVIMTRMDDTTVDIYDRMDFLNETAPDLCISIHHNSMGDTSNNAYIRGFLGLYWNEAGRSLAKAVSSSVTAELNRVERNVASQELAMLRNHKFPSALFEMSFICNPDEYQTALSPVTVDRSANGIVSGIMNWLDRQQQFVK